MKTFLLGFVAAFVLIPACTLGYFRLGLAGTSSDANRTCWETLVMQSAVRASVRLAPKGFKLPLSEMSTAPWLKEEDFI